MWQMKKTLTSLSLMEPGCPLPVVSHQQDPTILIIWTDWLNWHINVWFGRIMWTTQMMFSYWSGQCGMYQGWWGQLWLRGQAQSGDHACAVSPKKWPCTEQTFTKKKQTKKNFWILFPKAPSGVHHVKAFSQIYGAWRAIDLCFTSISILNMLCWSYVGKFWDSYI